MRKPAPHEDNAAWLWPRGVGHGLCRGPSPPAGPGDAALTQRARDAGYFGLRWQAQVPWRTFFWRDLVLVGTLANALMGFLALILLSQGADVVWAVAAHFALLPYNLFLVAAVWRWPGVSRPWKWAASVWFVATVAV